MPKSNQNQTLEDIIAQSGNVNAEKYLTPVSVEDNKLPRYGMFAGLAAGVGSIAFFISRRNKSKLSGQQQFLHARVITQGIILGVVFMAGAQSLFGEYFPGDKKKGQS